jgi:hypothetical protein
MHRPKKHFVELAVALLFSSFGVLVVADQFWVIYQVDRDVKQLQSIVSSLASSDPAYANLTARRSTHPKAWIFGTLDSAAQKDVLRIRVIAVFGDSEGNRIVGPIRLRSASSHSSRN